MKAAELDLHDHTAGEALQYFLDYYNRQVRRGTVEPITVIHGYGSSGRGGKIRQLLRTLLRQYPDQVGFSDSPDGNDGCTIVYPRLKLPTFAEYIAPQLCAYCAQPRPMTKILNEFSAYSARPVTAAVETLTRQKKLKVVWKGKVQCYQAD